MEKRNEHQSTFLTSFTRLVGNWPNTPEAIVEIKSREFMRAFEEYGPDRFDRGVTAIVDANPYSTFPTLGEFRGYVPAGTWREERAAQQDAEYRELRLERAANPSAFFGIPDVVCMMRLFQMRAAKGRPAPTEDEVFSTIAKVRERAGIAQ